jgi:hypothetical protein
VPHWLLNVCECLSCYFDFTFSGMILARTISLLIRHSEIVGTGASSTINMKQVPLEDVIHIHLM